MKTNTKQNVVKMFTTEKNSQKKILNPDFIVKLREMNLSKFIVLAICGPEGRGKSSIGSLLVSYIEKENQIEDYTQNFTFEPMIGVKSKAGDVFCYCRALKIPKTDMGLIILDLHGNGTLPSRPNEETAESFNLEKNLFIALSTASVMIYTVDRRVILDDRTNLAAYQNLLDKIKRCLKINYPGVIFFRNESANLSIGNGSKTSKVSTGKKGQEPTGMNAVNNVIEEERKSYINLVTNIASFNPELTRNVHATCFPSYTKPKIEDILKEKSAKESLDYILSVIQKYPKFINKENEMFMNIDALLFQIDNIIQQVNQIDRRTQLEQIESPFRDILQQKLKGDYRTIIAQLMCFFNDMSKKSSDLTEKEIKNAIAEETAQPQLDIDKVYEKMDERIYRKYKKKLNNFIQYHINQIFFQLNKEEAVTCYTAKREELDILHKRKLEINYDNNIESINFATEKAEIEQNISSAKDILQRKQIKIAELGKTRHEKETALNELKVFSEKEEKRTAYVRLLKGKIQKQKQKFEYLDELNQKNHRQLSELVNSLDMEKYKETKLELNLKKLHDISQDEISSREKEAEAEEMTKQQKSSECQSKQRQFNIYKKQYEGLSKEVNDISSQLKSATDECLKRNKELKELERDNNKIAGKLENWEGDSISTFQKNNKIEISELTMQIGRFKKAVENYESQIQMLKQDFSSYKEEYPDGYFYKKSFEISEFDRGLEEKKNNNLTLTKIAETDEMSQTTKSKIKTLTIAKENKIKQREILSNGEADTIYKMMDKLNTETIENEKRKIRQELNKGEWNKSSEYVANEICELKGNIANYDNKIRAIQLPELQRNLNEAKYHKASKENDLSSGINNLQCERDRYRYKYKQYQDRYNEFKLDFWKKSENCRCMIPFFAKLNAFLYEVCAKLKELLQKGYIKRDDKKKAKFLKLVYDMCLLVFDDPLKLKEQVNAISNNEMKRYMTEAFPKFVQSCESLLPMMLEVDSSFYQISLNEIRDASFDENKIFQKSKQIKKINLHNSERELTPPTIPTHECDDNIIDTSPYSVTVFPEISQELFASFGHKTLFASSDNFGMISSSSEDKLIQILEILNKTDETEIIQALKLLEVKNSPSEESPIKIIFESIKSKSQGLIRLLTKDPKFNKLLTTFYLYTDEIFRSNFNNLCVELFELPFIFEYTVSGKSNIFVNNEIVNTSQNRINFGFLPLFEVNSNEFYEEKTTFVNTLFQTNFIPKNANLNAQIRMIDIKDQNNYLFGLFLLNQNYTIPNISELFTYIEFLDILFLFIEPTHSEEIFELVQKTLPPMKDKLFVIILTTEVGINVADEQLMEDLSAQLLQDSNVILVLDSKQEIDETAQKKIYSYIRSNNDGFMQQYDIRKETMVNFLTKINQTKFGQDDDYSQQGDLKSSRFFERKNSMLRNLDHTGKSNANGNCNGNGTGIPLSETFNYLQKSVAILTRKMDSEEDQLRAQFKKIPEKIFKSGLSFNEYFNRKFLKQNFYLKNILQCEMLRSEVETSPDDREEYSRLIFYLRESMSKDPTVNRDILEFFTWMTGNNNGSFLTKFSLFTALLKSAFLSNKDISSIKEQFSFEHLLREIYNSQPIHNRQSGSISSGNLNFDNAIFFDLIKNYQPFELIDGDSLSFSIDNRKLMLGEKFLRNIFVVSIVGPQSTGKSTINNNIFSVGFQTSQGRCSRGIYGSLIPVKDNPNFSFILVLDTEGVDSAENKFDKMLTRRLLLFLLKVSHLVLLSPGQELKKSFAGEFLLACNNYINSYTQNAVLKPSITCLFNNVGAHRKGEKSQVFSTWVKILQDNLYLEESDDFKEVPIQSVFKFEEAEAIPNCFIHNPFKLLSMCQYFSYQEAFTTTINSIQRLIATKLADPQVQAVKFDDWLKVSKCIWNEISQIKNLTAIGSKNDLKIKKILNDILEDCKKQIKEISKGIETDINDFKKRGLSESDKCDISKLIKKMNDYSASQTQNGRAKIMTYFEAAISRKLFEKCPEGLKKEKVAQIDNIFRIIELEYQLLSFREIQKELKHVLYIGKSDFHNCCRMEANRIKQEPQKPNKGEIEKYFESYFQNNASKLLTSMDSLSLNKYYKDVFFYILLKADLSIDFLPYEHCFQTFENAYKTSEDINAIYISNEVPMFLPNLKDNLNADIFYQKSNQIDANPYVKILKILTKSNLIQVEVSTVLDHIYYDKIQNEIFYLLKRNQHNIVSYFGQMAEDIPQLDEALDILCSKLGKEILQFGFHLDKQFLNTLITYLYKCLGFVQNVEQVTKIIRENVLNQIGQFINLVKNISPSEISSLSLEYIDPNIKYQLLNTTKLYRIDEGLMDNTKNQEIYERGLRNYFQKLMYNKNIPDYEITKYSNRLLTDPEILNVKKLFFDINDKLLNIFQLNKIESKLEDYFSKFINISKNPFDENNIQFLLKYENEINRTAILDNATLNLIFGELDKIFSVTREGMAIYGFDITDYFKLYVYSYVIGAATFISHSNYKLKFLVMLNEFHKKKEELKKEFFCIIYNDYEELTKISVNNIFSKFIFQCESYCMDFVIDKYKNDISLEAAQIKNINTRKETIENQIAGIDINNLNSNSLTHDDINFYFNILVNPEEIYNSEFNHIWDALDAKAKEDCAKIYSTKLEDCLNLFEKLFQDVKTDFTKDIFRQELNDMFTVSQSGPVEFQDYASKGLFMIFKSYLTNYPLHNDFVIDETNNISITFNNGIPRTPNKYNDFPQDFKKILQNTFMIDGNIYNMSIFINVLEDNLLKYTSKANLNANANLDMGGLKNIIKVKFVECTNACPFCHRKCEVSHQGNEKIVHRCSLHQYRIMAGIKLDNDYPSFLLCDNIRNESQITFNGVKKTWMEIKRDTKEKYAWEFNYIEDKDKRKANNDLLIKIWKLFGKDICNYYNHNKNLNVKHVTFDEYLLMRPKTHYIFMLDYSGSMSGHKWNCVNIAFRDIMTKIVNEKAMNDISTISLGIFNHQMIVQAQLSPANVNLLNNGISPEGGTSYEEAFQGIYQLTHQQPNNFNELAVLFMTDGLAEYPYKAIAKIMQDNEIIAKTSFHIIYFAENKVCPALLKQIEGELAKKARFTRTDSVYEQNEVTMSFNEIISLNI